MRYEYRRRMQNVIISLGSNHEQMSNIKRAKTLLDNMFVDVRYSPFEWTEPIGMSSEKFLNGIACAKSPYALGDALRVLKDIERKCGRADGDKNEGLVPIDLDLLQYGTQRLHQSDWDRTYIRQLINKVETCRNTE